MKNNQIFFSPNIYLKNQIDDKQHVLEDAFWWKTQYYYYLDAIIFTREYLLWNVNYYSCTSYLFAKYLKTQQQNLIPMGENYELGLSNLTHSYTPITNQDINVVSHVRIGNSHSGSIYYTRIQMLIQRKSMNLVPYKNYFSNKNIEMRFFNQYYSTISILSVPPFSFWYFS